MGGGLSYPSAEVQSVYSTAPADWASNNLSDLDLAYTLGEALSLSISR